MAQYTSQTKYAKNEKIIELYKSKWFESRKGIYFTHTHRLKYGTKNKNNINEERKTKNPRETTKIRLRKIATHFKF